MTKILIWNCFALIIIVIAFFCIPAFGESQPTTITMVSGEVIGFQMDTPGEFYSGRRLDVSFSADGETIPVGSWCVDDIRRDQQTRRFTVTAWPVERLGAPTLGMDARIVFLEGAEHIAWLQKASAAGCNGAQLVLGRAYYWGHGVGADEKKGFSLILSAAESGHGKAQYVYAHLLTLQATPDAAGARRRQKSFSWYLKAVENGYWLAQKSVGHAYVIGNGTSINLTEAERWYRKAAANKYFPDEDPLYDFGFWLEAMAHKNKAIAAIPAHHPANFSLSYMEKI